MGQLRSDLEHPAAERFNPGPGYEEVEREEGKTGVHQGLFFAPVEEPPHGAASSIPDQALFHHDPILFSE